MKIEYEIQNIVDAMIQYRKITNKYYNYDLKKIRELENHINSIVNKDIIAHRIKLPLSCVNI